MRRDLRLADHAALFEACRRSGEVACAFVLDPPLLRGDRVGAPIVQFFFDALAELRDALRSHGSDLALLEGMALEELRTFARRIGAQAVFYSEDVDPRARTRDEAVTKALAADGIAVERCIDDVYYAAGEVLQPTGKPYVVYTPYRRRWMERLAADPRPPVDSVRAARGKLLAAAEIGETRGVPAPEEYGHTVSPRFPAGGERKGRAVLRAFAADHIADYAQTRNQPASDCTSRLSPHLRAGTVGVRTCVAAALAARERGAGTGAETWLGELVWRDFYHQILAHFPHVASGTFLDAARAIPWRRSEKDFAAWREGRTGYPIVDAAMAQLNETGWMHNRLRMIVASFLTKHLLIDWRKGERYFEQHLADGDLAANNGGWQWSASTGTDAAPYFRIFNPILQGKTVDPEGVFVRQFLPALARVPEQYVHEPWMLPPVLAADIGFALGRDYPEPIVDHAEARERALAAFAPVLGKKPAPKRR
jgi:deoxyribodipyrimidine photo-lyase